MEGETKQEAMLSEQKIINVKKKYTEGGANVRKVHRPWRKHKHDTITYNSQQPRPKYKSETLTRTNGMINNWCRGKEAKEKQQKCRKIWKLLNRKDAITGKQMDK